MRDFETVLPKHHLWIHMTARSERNGNPRLVANFLNESLNKLLKGACRNCSQMTFEKSVLWKMRGALGVQSKRPR